jgi:IS605 OrfB family transposase
MIRISKHIISTNTNLNKLNFLDKLFNDYKHDLEVYINYIIEGALPLKINLSSKDLPCETIKHSKYKREIYKQASSIIRSQLDKAKAKRFNKYKQLYTYFISKNKLIKFTELRYSELKLNNIIKTKYFTKPKLNNITINLTNEFYNIKTGNYFDNFINLKLPYFNEKGTRAIQINIPLNHHRHSNSLLNNKFILRNNVQIKLVKGKYFINLIWEKQNVLKKEGKTIGIDIGYQKLIVTSDNQFIGCDMKEIYSDIINKKRNSKEYKKVLLKRDNLINYHVNRINLENVNRIVVEELDFSNKKYKSDLKYERKQNDLMSRWTYRPLLNKIAMMCEDNGIELVKVSPAYTSQTCSLCGLIHKESRQGDKYKCVKCGYEIDADYNAAINIRNRGVYSLSNQKS